MRFLLAFSSFFRLLFGAKLHPKAALYLPEASAPGATPAKAAKKKAAPAEKPAKEKEPEKEASPAAPKVSRAQHHRDGAFAMLALLQREGRLLDFLMEPIDGFSDPEIGAAVRDIHRGCVKVLDDFLTIEAVMPGDEDDEIKVPAGFDPHEVRLVGEPSGAPPWQGVLRHHGWRITESKLPALTEGIDRNVVAPAEVEIGPS